jgi:hypothetical protein
MFTAAAKAKLPPDQSDLLEALFIAFLRPAMRDRDKLAHWCWGYALDLPDVLLLAPPEQKMLSHMSAISPPGPAEFDRSQIFVVTEADLTRTLERLRTAEHHLAGFMGVVWKDNPFPHTRASTFQQLSNLPQIQKALARHKANRGSAQEGPVPSSGPEPSAQE